MDKLKELLEQYSIKMEDVTAKGIVLEGLSEEDLVSKFEEAFGNKGAKNKDQKQTTTDPNSDDSENEPKDQKGNEPVPNNGGGDGDAEDKKDGGADEAEEDAKKKAQKNSLNEPVVEKTVVEEPKENFELRVQELEGELDTAKSTITSLNEELEQLREFKLNVEKVDKEDKVQKLFKDFQLEEADVESIDIHAFSMDEIEEKCYAILGRKLATKKNFSKENKGIHLPLNNGNEKNEQSTRYGNLFNK